MEPSPFAVVIPTRDRADVLGRCLDAVLAQSRPAAEVIVVNDGSSDGTSALLASPPYAERCVIVDGPGAGVSSARNLGLTRATADWVVFLDDDDLPLPGWLHTLGELVADDVGIVCAGLYLVTTRGRQLRVPAPIAEGGCGLFLPGAFAARRELLESVGGYLDGLSFAENSELRMRLVPECHRRGLRIATTEVPVLEMFRDKPRRSVQGRRDALLQFLGAHDAAFRADPRRRARLLCVAGVDSWRAGDRGIARRLFWQAARARPFELRTLARLGASLVPPLGDRIWRRDVEPGANGSDQ
ncbi:MAG: glycosyltransferase family 2 protein [Acidimicrobiales bacterium]|nr:glycosyltransferase family 2 protein [Acidimicrobiales bacterium]